MRGKMSFSDGQDGGSGRLSWAQNEGRIEAQLKAPLSQQSWTLVETAGGAELTTSKGERWVSMDASVLLTDLIGWEVPWSALINWVTGNPYDDNRADVTATANGYQIDEMGWSIQYSRLKETEKGLLPHKMVASKGPYRIKLSVSHWGP